VTLSLLCVIDGGYDECVQEVVLRRVAPLASMTRAVTALVMHSAPELFDQLNASGVDCRAGSGGTPDWAAIRELAILAGKCKADVLYAHGQTAHVLCALTGPLLGLPVIAHLTTPVALADAHAQALCGSWVIVANDFARSQALAVGCRNVAVVPTPARAAAKTRRERRGPVVGFCGTWLDAHGAITFLRAAHAVSTVRRDVRFRVAVPDAGSGLHGALHGLLRRVIDFAPLRFGGNGFAAHCDLHVHAAEQDATHVTLVDAIASGLPVVATTAGGSAELCRLTRRLRLYRAGDEDALVTAMLAACDDARSDVQRPLATLDETAAAVLQIAHAVAQRDAQREAEITA
jgi:glycosyltransferase involved in cell wall biosynthesis